MVYASLVLLDNRWEYLHGRMHAAGYALDPEFLYHGDGGPLDHATMQGLLKVVKCLSVRAVIRAAVDPADAARKVTVQSAQVQEHAATCIERFRAKEGPLTRPLLIVSAQN